MSGDVQPRKRKDKKKKKDEPPPFVYLKEEVQPQAQPAVVLTSSNNGGGGASSPDELIHIYKESRLGGNICAKIVFFLLLGTITVMVGLIITEYRGSGEVETTSDSPWSQMLEGWIDDSPPEHDPHDVADSGEDHEEDHGDDGGGGAHDEHEEEDEPDIQPQISRSLESERQVSDEQDEEEEEEEEDVSDHPGQHNEEEEDEDDEKNDSYERENGEDGESDEDEEEVDEDAAQSAEKNLESEEEDDDDDDKVHEKHVVGESRDDLEGEDNNDNDEDNDNEDDELEFLMHGIPGVTESAEAGDDDENEEDNVDDESKNENSVDRGKFFNSEEQDDDNDEEDNAHDGQGENQSNELSKDENNDESDNDRGVDDYEEFMVEREADVLSSGPDRDEEDEEQARESDEFEEVADTAEPTATEEESNDSLEPTGDEAGATTLQPTASSTLSGTPTVVPRRQTLIPPSTDPSSLLPEPDDVEEYSDEEEDEEDDGRDENPIHAKLVQEALIRKYGKLTPEASEEEVEEEEEEDEEDLDYEEEDEEDVPEQEFDKRYGFKYAASSNRQQSEEGDEDELGDEEEEDETENYGAKGQQWKSIQQRQPLQSSDPEVSDVDDLSVSEDELPSIPLKRTGGPQEQHSSEWPMGPDYPPQSSSESSKVAAKLEEIEAHLEENPEKALKDVNSLLIMKPTAPPLLSLRARALDKMAEIQRSNKLLEEAIASYSALLQSSDIGDDLFLATANRCINRTRFRGQHSQAIGIHKQLISRFPKEPRHRNDLAITYLMMGKVALAKHLLEETLKTWPKNGIALVHYGFILKTNDNKNKEGAHYMQAGIDTQENGTLDGRFLFHLGDAYSRMGNTLKATKIYELGVEKGMFRSKYQRSLYNVDHLTARPWWSLKQTSNEKYLRKFEDRWLDIKKEALTILETKSKNGIFQDEAENLRDVGDWKQLELYARGHQIQSNCQKAPLTCQLISQFPAARSCRRGQAKFSVMHPGTHVWPHCGPTNCRLRAHLGLVVPSGTEIRVGSEKRSWQAGKVFVFDDSFEHEVWHNGTSIRLVLIVDFWHPDLTDQEKRSLPSI